MTLSSPLAAQDPQKGVTAYQADDYATALQEWKPLADQGDAFSQALLGTMYYIGQGGPQDYAEAMKWFRLAADQGYASAQSDLGDMYFKGRGVPQDYAEAVKWYRLAADQGYARAQSMLGNMYYAGQASVGVLQDSVMAHMWYNISSANGFKVPGEWRNGLEAEMTPADISKAEAMASECMSSGYTNCMDQQPVYQQGLTAYDAAAIQACQDIKPNQNFNEMKRKKNCFRDLPLSYDAGAFQVCQDIKPNKNFNEMKRKQNCFRDLPLSY